jgi:hypothetical protein
VSIKHNRTATVRICTTAGHLGNRRVPRRLLLAAEFDELIKQDIRSLQDVLALYLSPSSRKQQHHLDCRVTIYLRGHDALLHPSYRFHWRHGYGRPGLGTKYRIDPPVGAVGYAYRHGKTQICSDIPDPDVKPDKYFQWWLHRKKYNHTMRDLQAWTRHPRHLIAIPFGPYTAVHQHSRAVLCIDINEPLATTKMKDLRGLVPEVEGYLDSHVAWKLLARRLV